MSKSVGQRISVAHILTDTNIGGAGVLLCNLLGASDRSVFAYSVILPENSRILPRIRALGEDIRVYTVAAPDFADRSYAPRARRELEKIIRTASPDIVHTHASLTGRKAARRAGVKLTVMTRHCSDMPPAALTKFPLRQLCGAFLSRTVTSAVATDETARDALVAEGYPINKIEVIHNGAPPLRSVAEEEKNRLRASLGIPDGVMTVGIFARLTPAKAHETFLRAAALCLRQTRDLFFLIVGDGECRDGLEALSRRYGLGDRVIFTGFVDDIAPYMAVCTVNVNTSVANETSNLALIEGMSMGVIPIVSDWGGNPRVAAGCGRVCAADEPAEFSDAILSLCRDPEGRAWLSREALRRYAAGYTAEDMTRRVESLYQHLMNDRSVDMTDRTTTD